MKKPLPPVIVISSHVVRGTVGNRAAVFALEVLGHRVWAVPTIILPFHPGHGKGTRIIAPAEQFEALLTDLLNSRWISEVGGVLTGYLAGRDQVIATTGFIRALKERTKGIVHVCDPVMGDRPTEGEGRLYVQDDTAGAIRDHLIGTADIITPNSFELSWLTGKKVITAGDAVEAAKAYPGKQVLVTSMPGFMRGNIGNLLVSGDDALFAEHHEVDNPPNGPGDLTAALFMSHSLSGIGPEKALHKTTSSVFEIVASAAKRGADELMLESDATSISTPMSMVQMRNLASTRISSAGKRKRYTPSSL